MRRVTMFRTRDAVCHSTELAARRHAKARFANALLPHAHALCQIDKYSAVAEYLAANVQALALLAELQADATLEDPDEEGND